LAEQSGTTVETIRRLENGSKPALDLLPRLASALRVKSELLA
jgi:transcriptional regulator with XRE-family HTH domain